MKQNKYVIGLDYGTDSVRAIIVDSGNGEIISSAVSNYSRWAKSLYCDASNNRFRQHPLDHIEGLEYSIKKAIDNAGTNVASNICAISIDTTGSTLGAIDKNGRSLAMSNEFKDNPNAMFILWKDHTSVKEANEITQIARTWGGVDYTKYIGGIYSSEWFWAKIIHTIRADEQVYKAAYSWVEHCDYLTAVLMGVNNADDIKRSRCAAGHKAMWSEEFDGLPPEEFLIKLEPKLKGLRERLNYKKTYTSDKLAGTISKEWANCLGLREDVIIGVGAFDSHMGAVGAEIKPKSLVKVIGTSTVDMMVATKEEIKGRAIDGICGQVDGSVIPNMIGLEAGQSAFGDIYAWFSQLIVDPAIDMINNISGLDDNSVVKIKNELSNNMVKHLEDCAMKIPSSESIPLAIDWMNGRRTPFANQMLKGAILSLNLGCDAYKIYKALVEATVFGAKSVAEHFISCGIEVKHIVAIGGVSKKSAFAMQILADVLDMDVNVMKVEHACALGAAMFASVAAGIYPNIYEAQESIGGGVEKVYSPNPDGVKKYKEIYEKYIKVSKFIEKEEV